MYSRKPQIMKTRMFGTSANSPWFPFYHFRRGVVSQSHGIVRVLPWIVVTRRTHHHVTREWTCRAHLISLKPGANNKLVGNDSRRQPERKVYHGCSRKSIAICRACGRPLCGSAAGHNGERHRSNGWTSVPYLYVWVVVSSLELTETQNSGIGTIKGTVTRKARKVFGRRTRGSINFLIW